MGIVYINKSEIIDFSRDYEQKNMGPLPITGWRARSHADNPFAKDDDILLVVAVDNQKMVQGYTGILPAILRADKSQRIFWNTCWWARPENGSSISLKLFQEFLRITRMKVLFSDLSERTVKILQLTGNFIIRKRKGAVIRFRSGLHSRALGSGRTGIKGRSVSLLARSGVFIVIDFFRNCVIDQRIKHLVKYHNSPLLTGIHDIPTICMLEFIKNHCSKKEVTIPVKAQVKWWQNSEWLVRKNADNASAGKRYYFSSFARHFRSFWIEFLDQKEIIGVAMLTHRDGVIKTPYLYYQNKKKKLFFQALLLHIISDRSNHSLITHHEDFMHYLSGKNLPFKSWKDHIRYTAVSNDVAEITGEDYRMQDGDGDYVFT